MKVCIVGAGAIGGWIGAKLAHAGRSEVSALARGDTLTALREHGWRLDLTLGGVSTRLQSPARAETSAALLGPQDLVIIAVKAQSLPELALQLTPLLDAQTVVMPAMNGVPWWFCNGVPGFGDKPLASLDPGGAIARALPLQHVIGCVVHAAANTVEPGLVQHRRGDELIIGEPTGELTPRLRNIGELLTHAGFKTKLSEDVRTDVWFKLMGNLTMNPVSALTGATMDRVLADPLVRNFCSAAMTEGAAVGAAIGTPVTSAPEERHAVTSRLGAVKTSMLQDVEAGRGIELDAIVSAVHEIGQRVGVATPAIAALLGLTRLMGQVRGLYPDVPTL